MADGTRVDSETQETINIKTPVVLGELNALGSSTNFETFEYTGSSKKLYLYSASGGINFYCIKFEASGTSSLSSTDIENASVVKTEYFNIAGQPVANPSGIVICKETLSNGKVNVSKIVK